MAVSIIITMVLIILINCIFFLVEFNLVFFYVINLCLFIMLGFLISYELSKILKTRDSIKISYLFPSYLLVCIFVILISAVNHNLNQFIIATLVFTFSAFLILGWSLFDAVILRKKEEIRDKISHLLGFSAIIAMNVNLILMALAKTYIDILMAISFYSFFIWLLFTHLSYHFFEIIKDTFPKLNVNNK